MRFRLLLLLALCAFLFGACEKAPQPNVESIRILKEKEKVITGTDRVTFQGEYAYSGVIDSMWLRVGTEEHLYGSEDYGMTLMGKTYAVEITGLQPGTFYYYAYFADYGSQTPWQSELYGFATSEEEINLPTVATVEVTGVTVSTASCLCHVADDGGAEVTERGACWSTSPLPDVSDFVYAHGQGLGDYSVGMVELNPNTTYYVRAYAKNRRGINYGEELSFTTLDNLDPPLGATNGLFSVDEGRQVWFSVGNLNYNPSLRQWAFAENSYEYIGVANANSAEDYDGWIDLFGWGTSGYNHGAVCYQPWSTDDNPDHYLAYGDDHSQLYDQTGQADWGYNDLFGEGEEGKWRTLTRDEWDYVLNLRNTPSGIRFAKAQVYGVNGLILLPDNWSNSVYYLNNVNQATASFSSNMINLGWDVYLLTNGAVFLPAAGYRVGDQVLDAGSMGRYYTSESSVRKAKAICIEYDIIGDLSAFRSWGLSVRLVRDMER